MGLFFVGWSWSSRNITKFPEISARSAGYFTIEQAAGVCLAAGRQRSDNTFGCLGGRTPLVVFATLLAVVAAANLRPAGPRDGAPRWGPAVAQARAECLVQPGLARVTVHIARWPVLGWETVLPCARLR
ncbi:hypothetical protein [Dactylosporangium sp. NPDC048998]|uniref:hypothetical protein n=1 Tax=Dactylosporangium sp. NPDC048998 TaxID=3363976 RepID=UPI00371815A9